jgi:hypothetical protein
MPSGILMASGKNGVLRRKESTLSSHNSPGQARPVDMHSMLC